MRHFSLFSFFFFSYLISKFVIYSLYVSRAVSIRKIFFVLLVIPFQFNNEQLLRRSLHIVFVKTRTHTSIIAFQVRPCTKPLPHSGPNHLQIKLDLHLNQFSMKTVGSLFPMLVNILHHPSFFQRKSSFE